MSISLFQIALLVLLVSGIVRVGILIDSIGRFVRLFEGELKEGSRLLFALWTFPGWIVLCETKSFSESCRTWARPFMWFFDLDELTVLIEMFPQLLILIGIVLPLGDS